uniref:PH domain-containing protein n=1 Tax=Photinus pyralis TaxID=7054 RepID=A0A1Y1M4M1_PHOPY
MFIQGTPTETHIYLFARSDREKEDWYRRFVTATHRDSDCRDSQRTDTNVWNEREYLTYMNKYQKLYDDSKSDTKASSNVAWINCMISRILFDCTRDPTFLGKLQQRIQRKLSSIKLPYFIEQLSISELSLGIGQMGANLLGAANAEGGGEFIVYSTHKAAPS